jgi:hypothetical protein
MEMEILKDELHPLKTRKIIEGALSVLDWIHCRQSQPLQRRIGAEQYNGANDVDTEQRSNCSTRVQVDVLGPSRCAAGARSANVAIMSVENHKHRRNRYPGA